MPDLMISMRGGKEVFEPGEWVSGTIAWELKKLTKSGIVIRLVWWTEGFGSRDDGCEASLGLPCKELYGSRSFSLRAPEAPYSFSGSLITLRWAVEATAGKVSRLIPIIIAPGGKEVKI